ncbi:unnamed protein product [Prunus armeniaca]|uniref:BED-type domain-containing protein n=1 Tax=Prunus armeniaca TaxID=36596 RepID=A0A6J5XB39_PRUAR|nr:unnamed protein product [Prunus armeniaca]
MSKIMVRGRDACWEHCILVDATKQKVRCNYCQREFSGGVYRMKFHLAQIKNKDIVPCTEVPTDVRDHILSILSTPKKQKTPKKPKVDKALAANGQQNSSSASGGFQPNHGSSGQNGSTCPSLLFACPSPIAHLPVDDVQKQKQDEMVDAVAECGVDYKAPSYESLRSTLLEKVKGCEDDATYLFELIESVVLEVGVEHVVQVITNTSASYVYAGRLLMAKYNSLFWSPCASYCINKMLEDIGKQEWVSTVLEEAKTITRFIYSHAWTLSMMRKFKGGRELLRPKITRFVTNFLTLRSIVIQEDNLKHMFSHTEWSSSVYSRRPEAQAIKSLLYLERFWKYAQEAVSISEPLLKILRVVDGDMPAMGYMYEGIERAKVAIKTHYKGIEEKYMLLWDIIDRRWNMQLHSSLHAAAASLNPSIFYSPNFKIDLGVRNGFQDTMLKMATTQEDKMDITKEHPMYVNAQGALGTDFAIMGRTLNAPGDWWAGYGYEIPTLQRFAIRILSQPCSSHWCCWNWTTFESLHSKKRNRAELEKFNDLVFVHCNLWLQSIYQKRDGKCKPIVFDEIDIGSDEWPTELDSPAPLLDDSWTTYPLGDTCICVCMCLIM